MGSKSKIEWTDATWNPIRGCSRVSEGCRNCYAGRFPRDSLIQANPTKALPKSQKQARSGRAAFN